MSKIKFEEKIMPGDGNCLFHSIGNAVNMIQDEIRKLVSNFLLKNKNKKFNGLTLEEWVRLETDMNVETYSQYILRKGEWGGNIELYICSQVFKINLFILSKKMQGYKVISTYVYKNKARNVFLIYDGIHYNYMKVIKNETGIKT
jgi:hypothetical protein